MPRSKHPKKASEEDIQAYKKIRDKIASLLMVNKNLQVMFQDEAGFGRINKRVHQGGRIYFSMNSTSLSKRILVRVERKKTRKSLTVSHSERELFKSE